MERSKNREKRILRIISLVVAFFVLEGERALAFSSETNSVSTNSVSLSKETSVARESQVKKEDSDSKPAHLLPASVTGVAPESPFFLFRQLLKMSPEDCEAAIKERPEKFQPIIRQKVEDYKRLPSQQSERSLQILDLRWYLFRGTEIQKDKLDTYIESVPADYQEIIRGRLECWFSLPEQQRTNILANVKAFAFDKMRKGDKSRRGGSGEGPQAGPRRAGFVDQSPPRQRFLTNNLVVPPEGGGTNEPPRFPEDRMGPSGQRQGGMNEGGWGKGGRFREGREMETNGKKFDYPPRFQKDGTNVVSNSDEFPPYPDLNNSNMRMRQGGNRWGAVNGGGKGRGQGFGPFRNNREERTWMELNNFFSMSPKEREDVVRCLPEKNREKIWRVMKTLDELPPVERQRSLKILLEISNLPAEERSTYVHSAERWNSLSSEEKVFFRVLFVPGSTEVSEPPMPPTVPKGTSKKAEKSKK